MKLAFGTYGTRDIDVFEVLPRLKAIGYETVELVCRPDGQVRPESLDAADRKKLSEAVRAVGFTPPVLMGGLGPDAEVAEALFRLTADLNFGDAPGIYTSVVSADAATWDASRDAVREGLVKLADLAAKHNVILAAEAHVGGGLDTPEKAAWLAEAANHPNLKLNFDISHFAVQGMDTARCVELCLPHTVHMHVKDGYLDDARNVTFLLPGEGDFDYVAFFRLLAERGGPPCPVCVEVSGMVSAKPDYDPWRAAESCYRVLDDARRAAETMDP